MILLIGGTGAVGTATARALEALGAAFTLATRRPGGFSAHPTVAFDWDRPETYERALQGANTVFLLTPVSDQFVRYTAEFARAAQHARVSRVVKLSVLGASPEQGIGFQRAHGASELALLDRDLRCTFVRSTAFIQNFVRHYGVDPTTNSSFFLPHGDGKVAWIDVEDVGAVIAACLTEERYTGRVLELTGPESITTTQVASALSKALSKTITYVDVPDAAARQAMSAAGLPSWMIDGLLELHGAIRAGHLDVVADGVKTVLGRDARTVQEYAGKLAQSLTQPS